MGGTFTSIQLHLVFSAKNREPLIVAELRPQLYSYMGGIIRNEMGLRRLSKRFGASQNLPPFQGLNSVFAWTGGSQSLTPGYNPAPLRGEEGRRLVARK